MKQACVRDGAPRRRQKPCMCVAKCCDTRTCGLLRLRQSFYRDQPKRSRRARLLRPVGQLVRPLGLRGGAGGGEHQRKQALRDAVGRGDAHKDAADAQLPHAAQVQACLHGAARPRQRGGHAAAGLACGENLKRGAGGCGGRRRKRGGGRVRRQLQRRAEQLNIEDLSLKIKIKEACREDATTPVRITKDILEQVEAKKSVGF